MSVVGVDTDSVGACATRFRGFPGAAPSVAPTGSGRVHAAVVDFSAAWGAADRFVAADDDQFVTRMGRAASLFVEAEASIAERGRREAA